MKLRVQILLAILFSALYSEAQTNIGGVVNTYVKVTNISNSCTCPTANCGTITVSSTTGFAVGDKVLLMQMKGAKADTTNTAAHGNILNLYDAGNYEFAYIGAIAGNVISTAAPLKQTYLTNVWTWKIQKRR